MHFKHFILTSLAVILYASPTAFACQCAGERPACEEFWQVSAVFIGTVINGRTVTIKEGNYSQQMRAVRISIDESFRGVEGSEVEVLTGFGGGDCGFGFRQAQRYLVYAYRSESDGQLRTSICTRTKNISDADSDLAYIRGLNRATRGATVSGEVVKYRRNAEGTLANQPLPGIRVSFEGEHDYETLTDAKGHYTIERMEPGEYTAKVKAPQGLGSRGPDKKIKLADRGCADVSFWLESSAQLSGTVINPQGLPVAKAEIFMIEADKERYRGHWDAAYSDEEGRYAFKLIPPGSYVLVIRSDGLTSQTRPFPTIYYPGVADKSQAKVFTIAEGQFIEKDLLMPPLPAEYDVQGTVVWSDGKPAAGASIGYMVTDGAVMYSAHVDDQGRFSFKAYEGLSIGLYASVKTIFSNSIRVTIDAAMPPIKLVLPVH